MRSTRREFVCKAGCAAVGALGALSGFAGRALGDDAKPAKRLRFANKGGFIASSGEEMIAVLEKYQRLGFDGLEADAPGLDVAAAKRAITVTGFPIHGVVCAGHWQNRLSSPEPSVRERGRKALEQAIRDSRAIGGTSVLLVPGKVSGADETHSDVWKRSIVEIRQALPVAKENEIQILIENVWNGFCETPEQFRDYIDEIGDGRVGIYFDIGNVRKFGKPEDWIALLGKRIGKLDVKDWGASNGFCRLGEGDVDWDAVRGALRDIGFQGWATREGHDRSLEDTADLMHRLLGET